MFHSDPSMWLDSRYCALNIWSLKDLELVCLHYLSTTKGASVLKWRITLLIWVLTTSPQSNSFYRLVFSLHIFQTSTKLSDFAVLSECLADCQTALPYHVYIYFPQHLHSQLKVFGQTLLTHEDRKGSTRLSECSVKALKCVHRQCEIWLKDFYIEGVTPVWMSLEQLTISWRNKQRHMFFLKPILHCRHQTPPTPTPS